MVQDEKASGWDRVRVHQGDQRGILPYLVHSEEHGEADKEINGVEQRPDCVHLVSVNKSVVWVVRDGQSLSVCCPIADQEDDDRHGSPPDKNRALQEGVLGLKEDRFGEVGSNKCSRVMLADIREEVLTRRRSTFDRA